MEGQVNLSYGTKIFQDDIIKVRLGDKFVEKFLTGRLHDIENNELKLDMSEKFNYNMRSIKIDDIVRIEVVKD